MRVCLTTDIAAPIDRVWRALTIPDEVRVWDGVDPLDVPIHYPQAGQHARWRSAFGPLRLTLHDRIREIDDGLRMAATIDIAFVHVDEEYRLAPTANGGTTLTTDDSVRSHVPGGTTLTTDDSVRSHVPGLNWLALRLTRANVRESMARLKAFCEAAS
jgi:uncharacterized protein YndB with AHSA1/START domain